MSNTLTETVPSLSTLHTASDPDYIPRGPVRATLNFFQDPADGAAPFNYVEAPPEGQPQRNFGETQVEVEINDIRGHESEFSLDKDAFQALSGVTPSIQDTADAIDFDDDEQITRLYYPEVEKLLLEQVPGAQKVTLFDHTIRRARPNAHRAPVTRVHVDQTARSTEWRVRLHDEDDAETLLQGRYRIINVWRPLNGPVQALPLAFASAETARDADLVPIQHRYPHRTGETAAVRHHRSQKFFYWSGMRNHERLLLKCFDSRPGVGQRVPHSAFVDPRSTPGARPRESIEVRALVYG